MAKFTALTTSTSASLLPLTGGTYTIPLPDYDTLNSVLPAYNTWLSAHGTAFTGGHGPLGAYTPVSGFYADFYGDGGGRFYVGDYAIPNTIYASDGADLVQGGQQNDTFLMGGGDDFVAAGDGSDTVWGGVGNDILYGQAGSDVLFGDSGADKLYGGSGDDFLEGGAGADLLAGGTGEDWASYSQSVRGVTASLENTSGNTEDAAGDRYNSIENLEGSSWNDTLTGDAGDNKIYGGAGDDRISGRDGNDLVLGGNGNDDIMGGNGNDALYGDDGDDVITGGLGDDYISGGSGHNQLSGNDGNDTFDMTTGFNDADGGKGYDVANFSGSASDWLVEYQGIQIDYRNGGAYTVYEVRQILDGDLGQAMHVYAMEQLSFSDGSILYL
jgi:Ca2+-binding RTX toxin-like protein